MAGYREITDPNEIAGIFGNTPPAVRAGGGAPAPALQGLREITDQAQIASIFGDGKPASFNDRFSGAPMASATDISADPLGTGLRSKADEMLVGKPDGTTAPLAALYRAGNTVGMNVPRAAASAIATGLGAVGVPGYSSRSYGENYDLAKDQEEALARQAPKSALAGTIAGIGAGAVLLPGFQAAKGAGLGGQALAAAGTGAAYGAAGSLLDAKDAGEVGGAALLGGSIGAAATPVISYAGKAVQALAPWVSKGISFTNSRGQYTEEAKAALGRAGVHPDLVPPRQLDDAISKTFEAKGVSDATAREAAAAEFAIPLSRGQATGDDAAQRFEMSAAAGTRGKRAETAATDFATRQQAAIDAVRLKLDANAGRGVTLENPVEAAERIADQARSRFAQSTTDAATVQRGADDALTGLRGPAPLDEVDAARTVAESLRGKAAEAKGRYQAGYKAIEDLPGEFTPKAVQQFGSRVEARIGPDEFIDPVLAPMASRFLADLKNAPTILKLEEGQGASAQQIEQLRKRASLYWKGAAQNPSDQRQLGLLRDAFDAERQAAAEVGLFGSRAAPARPATGLADDFPGLPAGGLPETPTATQAGTAEPMGRFMARNGGLQLTDDARAADLNRAYYPGAGTLARHDGVPLDQWRVKLVEAGYLPAEASGGMAGAGQRDTANEIMDALRAERTGAGQTRYRMDDEARIGGQKALDRVASENADNAAEIERQARRITIDMEGYGLRPQDLDRAALNDAAEAMLRRETDDAATAYDQAVAKRAQSRDVGAPAPQVGDDVPFPELGEGFAPAPAGTALPSASPEGVAYAETTAKARQLFSEYQRTFRPQGAGDDVGRAMRDVIERGREPVETARALYGGNGGLNARVADRVKAVVGEDSEAWAAHQQGYLSTILNGRDMAPQAVSGRIEAALSGPRRGLTSRILNEDQVAGLRRFQGATSEARLLREELPEWIATLGRTDFDPNSVMQNLFGAGIPGARPGSASYASALKRFVGEEGPEWSGLRQAAFRRLTGAEDGKTSLGPEAMADRIIKFTKGPGAGLAKQMFSADELAEMARYASALRLTFRPDGTTRGKDGGAAAKVAGHALDALATIIGFKVAGPAGFAAGAASRGARQAIGGALTGRKATQSFNGGAPRVAPPALISDFVPAGVASGLLVGADE